MATNISINVWQEEGEVMESIFYFKLHPKLWEFEEDGNAIFRAVEMSNGNYLVSTIVKKETIDVEFTQEEVTESMAKCHWIITDKDGETT